MAIALLALVGLVVGQWAGRADRTAGNSPSSGGAPIGPVGRPDATSAPDIADLSPRQRADRLFERVMRLSSEGKTDSVRFFAPMAFATYRSLSPLDAHLRYDYGRIAEVAGDARIAAAQADSILQGEPGHLLGLVLAVRAAELRSDSIAANEFRRRLLAAEPSESSRNLPEYERHRGDLLEALAEARRQ